MRQGHKPLKSLHCPLPLAAADTAGGVPGAPLAGLTPLGGGGVSWERPLVLLWLCSPSNGDCQASAVSALCPQPSP